MSCALAILAALALCDSPTLLAATRGHVHTHAMVRSTYHSRRNALYHHPVHAAYRTPYPSPYRTASLRRSHFIASSFNPTIGDEGQFDDPVVRQVAVDALGHLNGSVLVVNPDNGRVLTMVNQKLAFSPGFEPCSTIKPVIAVAALQKGLISRDSMLPVGRRQSMDLTEALAHSNNQFFEELGEQLGFDTVHQYASLLGLGEKAGYDLDREEPGSLPSEPPQHGGVARMSSFGEGIRITPMQLASLTSAVANGGTMYYLQYPQSREDMENFTPRVKRQLDIASLLPDLREGMLGAVLYGTAKRSYDPDGAQALGKTGTCNDETVGGRLGWFTSYQDEGNSQVALVVLLRGYSRRINGPEAAEVAGKIYKGLREHHYLTPSVPADLATTLAP
jgi:penicillin-binding protein 2